MSAFEAVISIMNGPRAMIYNGPELHASWTLNPRRVCTPARIAATLRTLNRSCVMVKP